MSKAKRPSSGPSGRKGGAVKERPNRGSNGKFCRAEARHTVEDQPPSAPQKEREALKEARTEWPPFIRPNGNVDTPRIEERFEQLETRLDALQSDMINMRLRVDEAPVSIAARRPATGAARERCPLCAEELVHTTLHVGGTRIVAGYCARCHPDALSALLR